MKGVHIAVDIMATEIMAKDIMATAARMRQRQRHSPVRRRPSSNSRRIGRPAAPTGTSASKPGRPRRPPKHNQQNKIEIAKKGTRFGSLSHLLQLVCPARRGGCLACERLSKNKTPTLRYTGGIVQATWGGRDPPVVASFYQTPGCWALLKLAKGLLLRAAE
jgi:hypothetical protein